jgi:superfamily II DNA/RNA helicase
MGAEDLELEFYEKFFFSKDLEPYPVQEEAFEAIFAGESAMVTVPTGTGKTMMAKAAIFRALGLGRTAIYTTPLRALTEEKFRELAEDFGEDKVGFATGDYQVNSDAPIQVVVQEILWNRVFSHRGSPMAPADVVVMDETHYFNDFQRGYVWEQSIVGLHPTSQLILLSATVGHADRFVHWAELTRKTRMRLIESRERKVPLEHQWREEYLIETVRDLAATDQVPAIIFVFGRERCFEAARLLKSCRRFTSDEERAEIEERTERVLLAGGVADELKALLVHGIGIHHAGVLPRYKALVERLTLERLLRFVVSTETISAGINLPAKRVVFPSLRKFIRGKARLLTAAEYHQMAGRAGRPQFDTKGIAIVLAQDDVVQELRKQIKDAKKRGHKVDEEKLRKSVYARFRSEAQRREDVVYDEVSHRKLVKGEPAELRSRTQITAEMVLAVGLPDLATTELPGDSDEDGGASDADAGLPPYMNLNIVTVVDNLLLDDRDKRAAHRQLAQVVDNLRALEVVDEHGQQIAGEMIGMLPGVDGLFVYYLVMNHQLDDADYPELVEFLVDHDVVQRILDRKEREKRRAWIRERLREKRAENPQVSWEDIEEEFEREHPRVLSKMEQIHGAFVGAVPHPELHGGKRQKIVWQTIVAEERGFLEFVDHHDMAHEEGSLFSYLSRCARVSKSLGEATGLAGFEALEDRLRHYLATVDPRALKRL